MDFPAHRKAAEGYELFPTDTDCMSLPHGMAAGENFIPDTLNLELDLAGMARDIAPPLRNMQKTREDFRRNGYNDVAYNYNIRPLASNVVGYIYPSRKPKQNIGRTVKKKINTLQSFCVFCRNNGASPDAYNGHRCKDERGLVCCPVLQAMVCPYCKATGPMAHTLSHCPRKPIITPEKCEHVKFSSAKWSKDNCSTSRTIKYGVPQTRNVKERREGFRNNHHNDIKYQRNFSSLSKNTPGSQNTSKKPLDGKTDTTSGRATLRNEDPRPKLYCTYCFCYGHSCWDERGLVFCPVLQSMVCHYCKATGKRAHTLKYCPYRPPYNRQGKYGEKY